MFRAALQNVDLFWVIFLYFGFLPGTGCRSADADSCHEVKTAYMMRQIGPVELVPDRPGTGQSVQRHIILLPCEVVLISTALKLTGVCFNRYN